MKTAKRDDSIDEKLLSDLIRDPSIDETIKVVIAQIMEDPLARDALKSDLEQRARKAARAYIKRRARGLVDSYILGKLSRP